jgi:hypothetical protein
MEDVMRLGVLIRNRRMATAFGMALLFVLRAPLGAQSLVVIPQCGEAGKTNVCVTGSGWAEPNPVCRYKFFFDGVQVAPDQPDGLFGPPNTKFVVPGGKAPGQYNVRVELRLNSPDSLLQSKESPFKVVSAADVSANTAFSGSTASGSGVSLTFTAPCDVASCTAIRFIQVVNNLGQKADGSTRGLTYTEMKFPNAADYDSDLSGSFKLDRIWGKTVPYYGVPGGPSSPGTAGISPIPATMSDAPNIGDAGYPADIVKIIWDFETAVFCESGDGVGRYMGTLTWHWERAKGGTATSSIVSKTRALPSANFMSALNKWNANPKHPFALPAMKFPQCS